MRPILITLVLGMSLVGLANGQENPNKHIAVPPAPVIPPEEALKTFTLEEGFRLELVASEPLVNDPVAMVWDGNGRIWVAEMTGYMPDIKGTNENDPVGYIAILDDTDGDSVMDQRKVFLDKLVLPRALALVQGGLLWADQFNLYFTPQLKDDKPGETEVVAKGWSGGGNVEHKPNGLLPGLDNWLYNAKSNQRLRFLNGAWVQEQTERRGQWGLAQDDYGRLVSNSNSSNYRMETLPAHLLQRNPHFSAPTPAISGSNRVYPSRPNTGINRGYRGGMLTKDGRLRGFTAACGLTVYRGDNFPHEYLGNIFVPEPSAHLVKRNIIEEDEQGKLSGRFAYEDKEFLTCTDERSRIVNAYTGPDGCLYLVDMYRGILQHRTYVTPYLREQIQSRGLDKPVGLGRIYRVVHKNKKPGPRPNMLNESSKKLVEYLAHPNGWWRDMAQHLLIQRKDPSTIPILNAYAGCGLHLAVIHALWTLEGMNALNLEAVEKGLRADQPKAIAVAIRMAGLLGDTPDAPAALEAVKPLLEHPHPDVQRQLAFSLGRFQGPVGEEARTLLSQVLLKNSRDRLFQDAAISGLAGAETDFLPQAIESFPEILNKLVQTIIGSGDADQLDTLKDYAFQEKLPAASKEKLQTALCAAAIAGRNTDLTLSLLDRLHGNLDLNTRRRLVKAMADKVDQRKPLQLETLPPAFGSLAATSDPEILKHLNRLKRGFRFEKAASYIITPRDKAQYADGKARYEGLCAACHHTSGEGMPLLGPPLVDSEWVLESDVRLIALTLNGLTGPIKVNGKVYKAPDIQPVMPGMKNNPDMTDEALANILTYIRNSWDHAAPVVRPDTVAEVRKRLEKQNDLFTEKTLRRFR